MMSMGETGAGGGPNLTMQADGSCEVSPLASSRGANWASMATRDRPVPLSRPVQIECDAHELRILDGSRRRVVKRVPLGDRTADAVDPLIYAVRQHVDSWGIAGDRMYWNPRLVLSATPQGASRRADLCPVNETIYVNRLTMMRFACRTTRLAVATIATRKLSVRRVRSDFGLRLSLRRLLMILAPR